MIFANIITHNGPGNIFAPRINEYGMMIIGVVGSAKNGCDGPIDSGNLEFSSVLFGCTVDFGVAVFGAIFGGPDLNRDETKRISCDFKERKMQQNPNLKYVALG